MKKKAKPSSWIGKCLRLLLAVVMRASVGAGLGLGTQKVQAAAAPIIIETSEAVKPGQLLTLFGENFESASSTSGIRINGTVYCPIIYTDPNGRYTTCKVPKTVPAGIWTVDAQNSSGWSPAVKINAPKPLWISNDEAWPGQKLRLVGRNFGGSEYGASNMPQVRVTYGVNSYPAALDVSKPYMIEFTVPDVPIKNVNYNVQVSTDSGASWIQLSEMQLTIVNAGSDPLGLGYSWANQFNWTQYNAKTVYGATGNGIADDTSKLQGAIDDIKSKGGGVLFLPNSTYRITAGLMLPAGVVIQGQSQAGTILKYDGVGGGSLIGAKNDGRTEGRVGVARLSLSIAGSNYPDVLLQLGEAWGQNNNIDYSDNRSARNIFIKEVKMDYSMSRQPIEGQRAIGAIVLADRNVAVQNNSFKGNGASLTSSYIRAFLDFTGNTFEYAWGSATAMAKYTVVMNNTLMGHRGFQQESRGFTVKTYSYVEGNTVSGFGGYNNDGEGMMGEVYRGGTKMYGNVASATTNTITAAGETAKDWLVDNHSWDKWHVLIVDGKGMGQLNEVTGLNQSTKVITLRDNWRVIPDTTSRFVIILPLKYNTFYKNTVSDMPKGLWFYGDSYKGVIMSNTVTDGEGVLVNTVYNPTQIRFDVSYFDRVEWNKITGVSPFSKVAGIGYRFNASDGTPVGNLMYGITLKDNEINGVLPAPAPQSYSEAPDVNGIYGYRDWGAVFTRPVGEAAQIEHNVLKNVNRGLTIDGNTRGLLMTDNIFQNVTVPYTGNGVVVPMVQLSTTVGSGSEGTANVNVTVTLDAPTTIPVSIDFEVTGGTATAGVDYTFVPGIKVFEPGQTTKTYPITIINDTAAEPSETIQITISRPTNALLGANRTYTYTIVDND